MDSNMRRKAETIACGRGCLDKSIMVGSQLQRISDEAEQENNTTRSSAPPGQLVFAGLLPPGRFGTLHAVAIPMGNRLYYPGSISMAATLQQPEQRACVDGAKYPATQAQCLLRDGAAYLSPSTKWHKTAVLLGCRGALVGAVKRPKGLAVGLHQRRFTRWSGVVLTLVLKAPAPRYRCQLCRVMLTNLPRQLPLFMTPGSFVCTY